MTLDALTRAKLTGEEAFSGSGTDRIGDDAPVGHPPDMIVLDFWRWSASDLLSNTMRGIVAEYIAAKALGLTSPTARRVARLFPVKHEFENCL